MHQLGPTTLMGSLLDCTRGTRSRQRLAQQDCARVPRHSLACAWAHSFGSGQLQKLSALLLIATSFSAPQVQKGGLLAAFGLANRVCMSKLLIVDLQLKIEHFNQQVFCLFPGSEIQSKGLEWAMSGLFSKSPVKSTVLFIQAVYQHRKKLARISAMLTKHWPPCRMVCHAQRSDSLKVSFCSLVCCLICQA